MWRGSDPWRRLILPHFEAAPSGLDLVTGTPSSDEGTREGRIAEIDRQSVIQHAACPRWRHRPALGTTVLVEPCRHIRIALAEAIGGHAEPDADGEAPLGRRDYLAWVAGHASKTAPGLRVQ